MRPNRAKDLLTSTDPEIARSPRSVVQIPMSTHLLMGSGGGRVSMDSSGSPVSTDEEEKDEDKELAHDDDE